MKIFVNKYNIIKVRNINLTKGETFLSKIILIPEFFLLKNIIKP